MWLLMSCVNFWLFLAHFQENVLLAVTFCQNPEKLHEKSEERDKSIAGSGITSRPPIVAVSSSLLTQYHNKYIKLAFSLRSSQCK